MLNSWNGEFPEAEKKSLTKEIKRLRMRRMDVKRTSESYVDANECMIRAIITGIIDGVGGRGETYRKRVVLEDFR